MNCLKVDELSYSYGKKAVLNNISFELHNGLIGLLGANGAGKTTMMKLITSIFQLQQGNIYLNDYDYKKDLKEIRQSIGYIPQDFDTYKTLTGREFMEIIANLKVNEDKSTLNKEIQDIAEKLEMTTYIDNKIKTYSGGMKQKLGFAQAMLGQPKLVVADEPTAGLDPEQRNVIRDIFSLISQDKIVIVTTHIVEDIEYYCNYLLVVKEGKLIFKGTKEEFINKTKGKLWEATVSIDEYAVLCTKCKIINKIFKENKYDLKYISENKLTDDSQKVEPNLQDAYIVYQHMF